MSVYVQPDLNIGCVAQPPSCHEEPASCSGQIVYMEKFLVCWRHSFPRRKCYGPERDNPSSADRTGKKTASGFTGERRQKNTPGGGGTAGEGFQKAKEKGYNSRELSQMLKNEGIIIPAYLIKRFFAENGNISVTQKQEAISAKKQTSQKAAFIVPDTSDKKIWYEYTYLLMKTASQTQRGLTSDWLPDWWWKTGVSATTALGCVCKPSSWKGGSQVR